VNDIKASDPHSLAILLFLSGDIHPDSDPRTNTSEVCTLNIRSLTIKPVSYYIQLFLISSNLAILISFVSLDHLLVPTNVTITPTDSACNLGVIFDSSLTFSDHISSVSKSRFLSPRDLRRIRNTLDLSTAQTIAASLINSKIDYCNSLFLKLPRCQLDRL